MGLIEKRYNFFKKYIFDGSILEAGCGDGKWLELLKAKGHGDVFGVDKDTDRIVELRKKGFRCEPMILENMHVFLPPRKFETVCCFDIIDIFHYRHSLMRNLEYFMYEEGEGGQPGSRLLLTTDLKAVVVQLKELFDIVDSFDDMYVFKRKKRDEG